MNNEYDVLIIGGGVIGAAVARELSHYKIRIALLEKEFDVSFGTSKSNSGIVHAGFHSMPGTLQAELCVEGNRAFDRLSEELEFPFERRGSLMAAFSEEEIQILHMYYERGRKNNVPYMEFLSQDKTLEMEPNLNPDVLGSLFAPSTGIVCPYEFCYALVEDALQNGLDLFTQEKVVGVRRGSARSVEVETEKGLRLSGWFVINAAGLYADEVAKAAGVGDFEITPRKGEEYLLDRRVSNLVRRVIYPVPTPTSKGLLVIPTVDGPVMVGPSAVDVESKTDLGTTSQGLKMIFEHAQKMVPSIRTSDIITSFAGLRPVATGDDFIIGPTKMKGFINAAGIQSPGLTSAPAIAETIRGILLKEGLKLEIKPDFIARRRGILHIRKAVEDRDFDKVEDAIHIDSGYAKLVCRCENVTEAEISEAVKRGHTSMDAIKFMTRAGTGRCQGGFCSSRVMKIIEKETGTPLEKISKKGPGSEILLLPFAKGKQD
ncbi:MAG: NAD(P)/FAD-dependent oxidoreductase [Candidatus Omnitrophica bacterium]|nr:NAD(P)/FAD-dependent oxidoreductase [Candidatus Omnitrophota bacterium]